MKTPFVKATLVSGYHLTERVLRRIARWCDLRRFMFATIGRNTIILPTVHIPDPLRVYLGYNVLLEDHSALITQDADIILGDRTIINAFARINAYGGSIELGNDCSLQQFSMISSGPGGIRIGNDVRIGAHTLIIGANHVFNSTELPIWQQGLSSKGIVIGDDVWIGSNVTILDGVTVGCGVVVAAGAVVIDDLPSFSVAGGVPARIMRSRQAK